MAHSMMSGGSCQDREWVKTAWLVVCGLLLSSGQVGCIQHYSDLPNGPADAAADNRGEEGLPDAAGDGHGEAGLPDGYNEATQPADSEHPDEVSDGAGDVHDASDQESESLDQESVAPDSKPGLGQPRVVPVVFEGESASVNWKLRPRAAASGGANLMEGGKWQLTSMRIGGPR